MSAHDAADRILAALAPALDLEALASNVLADVVGALFTLPGFEHHAGNSIAADVRVFGEQLRAAQAAPAPTTPTRDLSEPVPSPLAGPHAEEPDDPRYWRPEAAR